MTDLKITDTYENPLISRYASGEMSRLWGAQRKFSTWRRLWVALAESESELGLPITTEQINELRENIDNIDFTKTAEYELELRHDVMAHVRAYGDICPLAKPIIHLGATSCFVTDNTDAILIREALILLRNRIVLVIDQLGRFALRYRDLPCLSFTHLQPAQPATVGRRACLWAYDLILDLIEIERRINLIRPLGNKGTTGTQASFLKLFNGDHEKVKLLEQKLCKKIGFDSSFAITGQTYPRKQDSQVLDVLSGIAQSSHKFATDLRILANRRELEEPFETHQVGSSAMAYKRNPMRSERICSIARFVISLQSSTAMTAATQWLERTLDDSANRRLVLPQAFLAVDAILILYSNITDGIEVYPKVIERNLKLELPFMATENILMAAVKQGGDRQFLHEKIRQHAQNAVAAVKNEGGENDLLKRLRNDADFSNVDIDAELNPITFIGRSIEQVDDFIADQIEPIRKRYEDILIITNNQNNSNEVRV
ncbi:MAG: adenylosuccinate lyase [Planctomycetaceae bacterium]|jgi:adenylosuccinate lyase|nr:adenylosuccinate lyase [Planctomycetaceae bacterium]